MFLLKDFSLESRSKLEKYIKKNDLHHLDIGCGVPIFNSRNVVFSSLRSLILQEESCLIFISDDDSVERTAINELLESFDHVPNIIYFQNPTRIGQLRNTKLVRDFFINLIPSCKFYFLASDHDLWHRQFASRLKKALDNNPTSIMAFSKTLTLHYESEVHGTRWESIREWMNTYHEISWINRESKQNLQEVSGFQKTLVYGTDNQSKISFINRKLSAGNMIYGMENLEKSKKIPYYEPVLGPDRLFLLRALGLGSVVLVDAQFWLRIQFSSHDKQRQISQLFIKQATPGRLFLRLPDIHHSAKVISDKTLPMKYRISVVSTQVAKIIRRKLTKSLKFLNNRNLQYFKRVKHRLKKLIFLIFKRPARRLFHQIRKRFKRVLHFSLKKILRIAHFGSGRGRRLIHKSKKIVVRLRDSVQ